MSKYQTILVAFCVEGNDREEAQYALTDRLADMCFADYEYFDSWWIAEDDRVDGSDNDSAVFVPMGKVALATAILGYYPPTTEEIA